MTATSTYGKANKSNERGKYKDSIQSSTIPNSGQKHKKTSYTRESSDKAAMNRQDTQITKIIHKISTRQYFCFVFLLEGLNEFNSTNLILISDKLKLTLTYFNIKKEIR